MDITQIPLKINQTIQSDGAKLNAELEPKLNSFFNILYGQYLKSTPEAASDRSVEAAPEVEIQANQQLVDEDWQELETILVEVLSIFKEIKSLLGTSAEQMNHLTTSNEPQLNVIPSFKNLLQDVVEKLENQTMNKASRQPLEGGLEGNRLVAVLKESESLTLTPEEQGKLPLFNNVSSYVNGREDRSHTLEQVASTPSVQQLTEEWSNSLFGKVMVKVDPMNGEASQATLLSRKEVDILQSNKIRPSEALPSVLNKQPNWVEEANQPLNLRQQAEVGTQGLPVKNDLGMSGVVESANLNGISREAEAIFTTNDVQIFENFLENGAKKESDPVFQQRREINSLIPEAKIAPKLANDLVSQANLPIMKEAELSDNHTVLTGKSARVENGVGHSFQRPNDVTVPVGLSSELKEQPNIPASVKVNMPMPIEDQNPEQVSFKRGNADNSIVHSLENVEAQQVSVRNNLVENSAVPSQVKIEAQQQVSVKNSEVQNNVVSTQAKKEAQQLFSVNNNAIEENSAVPTQDKMEAQQLVFIKNIEAENNGFNRPEKMDALKQNQMPVSMNAQQQSVVNSSPSPASSMPNQVDRELDPNGVETKDQEHVNRSNALPEDVHLPEGNKGRVFPSATFLNGDEQRVGLQENGEAIASNRQPEEPFVSRFAQAEKATMINRATPLDQEVVNHDVRQPGHTNVNKVLTVENPTIVNHIGNMAEQPELKTMNVSPRPFTVEHNGRPVTNGMGLQESEQAVSNLHLIGKRNSLFPNQINEQPNRIQTLENVSKLNLEPDRVEIPQRYINLGFEQSKETSQEINRRSDVNQWTGKPQLEGSTNLKTSEKLVLPTIAEANSFESGVNLSPDMVELQENLETIKNVLQTNEDSQVELADYLRPVRMAIDELQSLASLAEREGAIRSDKSTFVQNAVLNLQDNLVDALNQLGEWLQKVKDPNQAAKLDYSQMMEDLVQFVAKQPAENEKKLQIPDKVKNDIQQLLDQLDLPIEGEHSVKQTVGFDRNQMAVGADPRLATLFNEEKRRFVPMAEVKESSSTMIEPMNISPQEVKLTEVVNNPKPTMPAPSVPVPEFAARMSEWIGRNLVMQNGKAGNAETRFLLNPEHLGPVEIKISFDQDGKLTAQILTDTGSAKEILETQLQQLKQNLQQQGLVVQKLDVTQQVQIQLQDSNQTGMMFYEGGSGSSQEHQNPQSNEKRSKNPNEAEQMELENDQGAFTYGGASRKSSSQIDFTA